MRKSPADLAQAYNSELGNKVGNLFSRAGKFAQSRFDGKIPARGALTAEDERVRKIALEAAAGFARDPAARKIDVYVTNKANLLETLTYCRARA
jgi:methionyl-tRNA synthetase